MRLLAAMSGGVDSAVAAALAHEAGHDVVGVHMALSKSRAQWRTGSRGCCSIEDASDARRAADVIGIPYYVWDLSDTFEQTVIADFLSEYSAGRTPNPCVRCNEHVKFRVLLDRALALGFDGVVTGHYARIVRQADGPGVELHRARDAAKDQSYVLAVTGAHDLQRVILPLGEVSSKAEVRQMAEERGLSVSHKPDSYDICFIADGDTSGFLRERLGSRPGQIVDQEGAALGEHDGTYGFTVGQRKGLGIDRPAPDGEPRYVLRIEPVSRTVVVGPSAALGVDHIRANDVTLLAPELLDASGERPLFSVQYRAHGTPLPAEVTLADGELQVTFAPGAGARAVAPGQSLVVYAGTRVVAQGTVARSWQSTADGALSGAPEAILA